jgi:ferredoxin-NADP reductase
LATSFAFAVLKGSNLTTVMRQAFIDSPLLFFAFVMLTEPLTTPPTKRLQIYYGAIVGFLFAPQVHVAGIYSTPELALVVGNVFSYLVSPKEKLLLVLREKLKISPTIYDFVFESNRSMAFRPGQYLEWTLGHKHADSRGNRRYFTIASAPTEKEIRMGVKFYEEPSSFKKTLEGFRPGSTIVAGQLAGDFVLPEDQHKKLVFIAGGIGVTPFRSMIKYLIDTKQKRDIVLFYSNKEVGDVVYTDVFEEAAEKNGLKTVYTLTDRGQVPPNWQGQIGMVNEQMIKAHVPDYKDRLFYISGPRGMITAFEDVLAEMGISRSQIKVDFFPGFA